MGGHKHIERAIGAYIASHYHSAAEIGVGNNFEAALFLLKEGRRIFCTDIKQPEETYGVPFVIDDLFSPDQTLYRDVDLIYAIRPGEEMIPALIALTHQVDCDLIVYHLGFEGFGGRGEIIDCGVILYRYYKGQKPSKSLF
jgi:uncharacterized UPF0146 family protein